MTVDPDGSPIQTTKWCDLRRLTPRAIGRYGYSVHGATQTVTRRLWNEWGPLPAWTVNDDQVVTFRAALSRGIFYIDQVLVVYRMHMNSWIAATPTTEGEIDAGLQHQSRKWSDCENRRHEEEMLRRNIVLAKNRYENAKTAFRDATRLGRVELYSALKVRLAEAELIACILKGEKVRLVEVLKVVLRGGRPGLIARAFVKRRMPFLYSVRKRMLATFRGGVGAK